MKNLLKIVGTLGMSATIVAGSTSVVSCKVVNKIVKALLKDAFKAFHLDINTITGYVDKMQGLFHSASGFNAKEAIVERIENFFTDKFSFLKELEEYFQGKGLDLKTLLENPKEVHYDIIFDHVDTSKPKPKFGDLLIPGHDHAKWFTDLKAFIFSSYKIGVLITVAETSEHYTGGSYFLGHDPANDKSAPFNLI